MQDDRTETRWLQLGGHKGKTEPKWALVDAADFEWLSAWKWSYVRGYGYRHVTVDERKTTMLLHRQIMGLAFGEPLQADHKNRDRLDNRRCNLRIVTGQHNWQNTPSRGGTSRHRGVSWHTQRQRWDVRVHVAGVNHRFGLYTDEEEAAAVARSARLRLMPGAVD